MKLTPALPTLAALVLPFAITGSAPAPHPAVAWPRIIMFYGGVLGEQRRYVTDQDEVIRFLDATKTPVTDTTPSLAGRPFVEVVLYWHNPTWGPYAADTALLKTLPIPNRATYPPHIDVDRPTLVEPARVYLAHDGKPALFEFTPGPPARTHPLLRTLSVSGLEILRSHGVPIRYP